MAKKLKGRKGKVINMEELSLNELYRVRDELSFQLVEANSQDAVEIEQELDEVEQLILVREGNEGIED
jgi:hypothetical protein